MKNIPNILSVLRLFMAAGFTYAYLSGYKWVALSLFLLASITDAVDGFIARRFDMTSELGKLLDPLADKVLTLLALFCLMVTGHIAAFIFYLMLFKEVVFITLGILNLRKKIVVYSQFFGKVTTVLFFCGIVAHLLDWSILGNALLYTGLVSAGIAAVQYFFTFIRKEERI